MVFKHQIENLDQKLAKIKSSLITSYPFIPKIDIDVGYLKEILDQQNRKGWGAWIKFFCTAIYGQDLTHFFQDIEIDREVIEAINKEHHEEIHRYFDWLELKEKPLEELSNIKKSLIKRMIRLLPLTLPHVEKWPLSLNDTIDQAIQVYPQQKDELYFLLKELNNPQLIDEISLNRLKEIYTWVDISFSTGVFSLVV